MEMLLQRFEGCDCASIESQLTHIQQKTFVDDYLADFTRLSCLVTDWIENQLKHMFLGGLKEDICHEILTLEPKSLHQAQKLAIIFLIKSPSQTFCLSPPLPTRPTPLPIPSSPLQRQQPPQGNLLYPITPAEVQEKC